MINNESICAIIPVRAGSKRLPNKNILPFGDSNLLIHKIRQLKKVPSLDEIVVSSDSEEMLEMAKKEGVKIHKRALEYADEKTKSFGEVVAHLAELATNNEHIMWAPCVCPLVTSQLYEKAIQNYKNEVLDNNEFDSLISTKLFKEYLWDERKPVNYELGLGHVPSQKLPDWQVVINGFYIASRKNMMQWSYFFGQKPYRLILDKKYSIDIDDADDFAIAEALYKGISE